MRLYATLKRGKVGILRKEKGAHEEKPVRRKEGVKLKAGLENISADVEKIFEHLHQHPEVSWKELQTTEYIRQMLEGHGCRTTTFDDCTGVIGEIGEGSPTVAIRADLDALWQEIDGTFQANHSCGHDAHMTMVLGVLLALNKQKVLPQGTIKFIFQPAEEKGTGALKIVENNVVDDVDFLYGVHLRPVQELNKGTAAPAIRHGAARFVSGKIAGEDAHAARPHLGTSAVEIVAALVQMLNGIHLDPSIPYSIKVTQFNTGGGSSNIIAGSAKFSLDLRSQSNEAMETLVNKVDAVTETLSHMYNADIRLSTVAAVAAAEVNLEAEEIMAESIKAAIGKANLKPPVVTTGGDDFHFYTLERPHLKATMLGLGCDLKPGLHHPQMTFDRAALLTGIEILMEAIMRTLQSAKEATVR
jgi:amidohydrolase